MGVLFANNAATTLAAGIGTGTTTVTVASGEGAKFPSPTGSDWFPVVLQRKANYSEVEIARCTDRSGDTLTLQRAQEGTTALTFVAGDILDLRLTAEAIAAINADLLDGEQGSFYTNASNLSAGTLPAARFNNTSHGDRDGGSLHSAATTSVNGFMSSSDKTKLDGVEAGAQVNVGTDLELTGSGNSRTITSSTGNNVFIPVVTGTNAGFMATGDKTKLDSVETGAQVNVATNLSRTIATASVTVSSSTGDNATIPAATTSAAGVMAAADKSKLDGIEDGAEVNVGTNLAANRNPTNVIVTSSTGNNATIPLVDASNSGVMSPGDKTKLDGIEAGAQVNVGTDLSRSVNTTTITVISNTGNDTILPAATNSAAGVMTSADKTKLDAVGTNANRNLTISTATPSGGADGDVWYQYE